MRSEGEFDSIRNSWSLTSDGIDQPEEETEDEERSVNAVSCPLLDTPVHFTDCALCADRGWVLEEDIATYLGPNQVACMFCGGEGYEDGAGPVTWTCAVCLSTGQMPAKALEEELLRGRWIEDHNLCGADLREVRLDRLLFSACDFSEARFGGADLTDAAFEECRFRGANLELAASLDGADLTVSGLSKEQEAICAARGASVEDRENEEDGPAE
jgi:hypothetical protein